MLSLLVLLLASRRSRFSARRKLCFVKCHTQANTQTTQISEPTYILGRPPFPPGYSSQNLGVEKLPKVGEVSFFRYTSNIGKPSTTLSFLGTVAWPRFRHQGLCVGVISSPPNLEHCAPVSRTSFLSRAVSKFVTSWLLFSPTIRCAQDTR